MKTVLCLAIVSLFSTGLMAGNWLVTQHPEQATVSSGSTRTVVAQDSPTALGYYNLAVAVEAANESQNAVNAALKALKAADDDDARRKAESELKSALEADYDSRLDGYAEHLDRLESELSKMKDQLQKRRMAKSEMVNLRLQVLKAEADDLGWPNESGNSGFGGFLRSYAPSGAVWSTSPAAPAAAAAVRGTPAAPTPPGGRSGGRQ